MSKSKLDRRGFLKGAGAALAGGAALAAGGRMAAAGPAGRAAAGRAFAAVRPDPEPYKMDESVYQPFSNAKTCFSRLYQGDMSMGADPVAWRVNNPLAHMQAENPGYSHIDYAFQYACQAVGAKLTFSGRTYDYRDESVGYSFPDLEGETPLGVPKLEVSDPAAMSGQVKKAARLFGADLVGVCRTDPRWMYSEVWLNDVREVRPLEFPEGLDNAVVLAFEMDYDAICTSPTCIAAGAVAHGYSRQDSVALYVAEFIKGLGYRAIPTGNDTALSVPMAIDAGLGEFSRSGMLVTPQYGPRVRLSKVFTDLPLAPDKPIRFGVREFCRVCKKCADSCPSGAISHDTEPTWSGPSISNNPGIYKWYVNVDKCLKFWCDNGVDCINCIASCPYNKPSDMWHHAVGATLAPTLGRAWVTLDDMLGYGEQKDPNEWWNEPARD